eukprot:TRINITY_DN18804_c0_g1_i2.p4 TRINITY_DN18804_c0_g1~~TRINITY_DN18804_c0_g1_i2.p4  ORF type:complete len:101 (-),score=2.39 TRINITY_DN18804_c0_g1_i2:36-338(-)
MERTSNQFVKGKTQALEFLNQFIKIAENCVQFMYFVVINIKALFFFLTKENYGRKIYRQTGKKTRKKNKTRINSPKTPQKQHVKKPPSTLQQTTRPRAPL